MNGAERIAAERQRQIDEEGYTAEHDRGYADELFAAAACYAISAHYTIMTTGGILDEPPELWPWDRRYWKPTGDPVRDGEKSGALSAAGIDAREGHPVSGLTEASEALPTLRMDLVTYVDQMTDRAVDRALVAGGVLKRIAAIEREARAPLEARVAALEAALLDLHEAVLCVPYHRNPKGGPCGYPEGGHRSYTCPVCIAMDRTGELLGLGNYAALADAGTGRSDAAMAEAIASVALDSEGGAVTAKPSTLRRWQAALADAGTDCRTLGCGHPATDHDELDWDCTADGCECDEYTAPDAGTEEVGRG